MKMSFIQMKKENNFLLILTNFEVKLVLKERLSVDPQWIAVHLREKTFFSLFFKPDEKIVHLRYLIKKRFFASINLQKC